MQTGAFSQHVKRQSRAQDAAETTALARFVYLQTFLLSSQHANIHKSANSTADTHSLCLRRRADESTQRRHGRRTRAPRRHPRLDHPPGTKKFRQWLTDDRRQALHAALGTLATLAVTAGWINDDQSLALVGLAGALLALQQGVLALTTLRPAEGARWFGTAGRGLMYAAATAAAAAGVAFGFWVGGEAAHVLAVVSVALTALSSFVSVVNVQTVPEHEVALASRRAYRHWLETRNE